MEMKILICNNLDDVVVYNGNLVVVVDDDRSLESHLSAC